jgi:hypothetical protein
MVLIAGFPKGEQATTVHKHITRGHKVFDQGLYGAFCLWDCV